MTVVHKKSSKQKDSTDIEKISILKKNLFTRLRNDLLYQNIPFQGLRIQGQYQTHGREDVVIYRYTSGYTINWSNNHETLLSIKECISLDELLSRLLEFIDNGLSEMYCQNFNLQYTITRF